MLYTKLKLILINTYKDVFKNTHNEYKKSVSFDEIYALFEFDNNLRSIFLKYSLEIEMIFKSLLAETEAKGYGYKVDNISLKEKKVYISKIN